MRQTTDGRCYGGGVGTSSKSSSIVVAQIKDKPQERFFLDQIKKARRLTEIEIDYSIKIRPMRHRRGAFIECRHFEVRIYTRTLCQFLSIFRKTFGNKLDWQPRNGKIKEHRRPSDRLRVKHNSNSLTDNFTATGTQAKIPRRKDQLQFHFIYSTLHSIPVPTTFQSLQRHSKTVVVLLPTNTNTVADQPPPFNKSIPTSISITTSSFVCSIHTFGDFGIY